MCSMITDALKKFENQDEKEKLAQDTLNAMMELTDQQTDAFYLKIALVINLRERVPLLTKF